MTSQARRGLVAVFGPFFAAAAVTLVLDAPAKGWFVVALVVAFNVAFPLMARRVDRDDWFAMWALVLPLSVFQIMPDWILVDVIGTLQFPDVGGPRVADDIALAMGGMWAPPLLLVLLLADGRPGVAALTALLVFGPAELLAPVLQLWEPTGVATEVAGIALYVLPAEAALGWASACAYQALRARDGGWALRIGAGGAVATFYTGALVVAYFLIDVADWSLTF